MRCRRPPRRPATRVHSGGGPATGRHLRHQAVAAHDSVRQLRRAPAVRVTCESCRAPWTTRPGSWTIAILNRSGPGQDNRPRLRGITRRGGALLRRASHRAACCMECRKQAVTSGHLTRLGVSVHPQRQQPDKVHHDLGGAVSVHRYQTACSELVLRSGRSRHGSGAMRRRPKVARRGC